MSPVIIVINTKKTLKYVITIFTLFSVIPINNCLATDKDYPHIASLSGSKINNRYISELEYMVPIWQSTVSINIIDIKFKKDNKKSIEGNLGIIHRHNFSDKAILGIYSYFDRRKTKSNLTANQLTTGLELLTPYIDGRFNLYTPSNKKKVISPSSETFVRENTKVYVINKEAVEEHLLPGYDIELGIPLFTFLPSLNERYGTKFRVKKFKFSKKGALKFSGVQYAIEQKIKDDLFGKSGSELTLSVGGIYNNNKKWDSFVNLGMRWSLMGKSSNTKLSKLEKRMMDKTTRDIDIVTSLSKNPVKISPVYWEGKEIQNVYFVGETDDDNYNGDGSYENPFSKKQLIKLMAEKKFQKKNTDLIIPIILKQNITRTQYYDLIDECSAIDVNQYTNIKFEDINKNLFYLEHMSLPFPEYEYKNFAKRNNFMENDEINSIYNVIKESILTDENFSAQNITNIIEQIQTTENDLSVEIRNSPQRENQALRFGGGHRRQNADHIAERLLAEILARDENEPVVQRENQSAPLRLHHSLRTTPLRTRAERLAAELRAAAQNDVSQQDQRPTLAPRRLNF
jgi:hypothetical protein